MVESRRSESRRRDHGEVSSSSWPDATDANEWRIHAGDVSFECSESMVESTDTLLMRRSWTVFNRLISIAVAKGSADVSTIVSCSDLPTICKLTHRSAPPLPGGAAATAPGATAAPAVPVGAAASSSAPGTSSMCTAST